MICARHLEPRYYVWDIVECVCVCMTERERERERERDQTADSQYQGIIEGCHYAYNDLQLSHDETSCYYQVTNLRELYMLFLYFFNTSELVVSRDD